MRLPGERKRWRVGRAAPVFAQLKSEKAEEAGVFLGQAEGEAFPCVRGVDRLGQAIPGPNTWAGWLEKNWKQQDICL